MKDVRYWFGWLMVVLVAHVTEQFIFGLDELYELKGQFNYILGHFATPDYFIVALVGIVVLLVMTMNYGHLVGGRGRLFGPIFFGVSGLVESHHFIKTVLHRNYFSGAVTAIPFVFIGFMLLRASIRELTTTPAVMALDR